MMGPTGSVIRRSFVKQPLCGSIKVVELFIGASKRVFQGKEHESCLFLNV